MLFQRASIVAIVTGGLITAGAVLLAPPAEAKPRVTTTCTNVLHHDFDLDGTVITSTLIICTTRTSDGFYGTETYDQSGRLNEVCSKPRGRQIECAEM